MADRFDEKKAVVFGGLGLAGLLVNLVVTPNAAVCLQISMTLLLLC